MKWVSRARKHTICRLRGTVLLNVGALSTFPKIFTSWSFRSSAAFLMESLGTYTAPHGTLLERRAAEHLAHLSFEFFASARDKPWFGKDFSEGGVGRGGELSGDNEGCGVADGEEWRWQCQILVERARALVFPLGFTNPLQVAARWQTLPRMDSRNDKLNRHNGCG